MDDRRDIYDIRRMSAWLLATARLDRPRVILLAILSVGFLLRISGILWGIPFPDSDVGWYHPDEPYIFNAVIWAMGIITATEALNYPTFFPHLIILLTFPLRLYLDSYSEEFLIAVALVGRFCSVLAGTGAIYVTYRLARDLSGRSSALLASAFLAFSLYHAQNSSFVTPDVLTSFFLILFLWFLRRAFLQPDRAAPFLLAGMVLGLLVGTKYTGILAVIVVPLLYIHAIVIARRGHGHAPQFSKMLLCAGAAVLTFVVTTPGPFLDLPTFLNLAHTLATRTGWTETARWDASAAYHSVATAIGWPLTWLLLLGVVFPLRKNGYQLSFIVLPLAVLVYFGTSLFPRYVIMVTPVIAIVASDAARALYDLGKRLKLQLLPGLAVAFVVVYSFGYCVIGAHTRYDDTRTQTARYLRAHFPSGTGLGIGYTSIARALAEYPRWMNPHADYSFGRWNHLPEIPRWWIWLNPRTDFSPEHMLNLPQMWTLWNFPKIDFTHFRYTDFLDYPDVVVLSSESFSQIEAALKSEKLSKDYIWDQRYNREWYWSRPPSPRIFAFYDMLLDPAKSSYALVRTIKKPLPAPIEFGSPEIRVYVASPLAAKYQRERAELSFADVHYYPPYSEQQTRYSDNPRGYFKEEDLRKSTWRLTTQIGSSARVEFPAHSPELMQIAIQETGDPTTWHVQLSQSGLPVRQQKSYILSFRARAAAPRQMGVGVGRTHGQWDDVGLYRTVALDEVWQPFRFEFVGTSDEDAARVYFDLGGNDSDVDLDQVRLEAIAPDGHVEPVLSQPPSYDVNYRFNGMGCRGPDYPVPRPVDTTRVLLLGNSWALGAGVHEEDALSSRLQVLLNEGGRQRRSSQPFEVINCGANDYGEREARLFYEIMASQYEPDIVFLLVAPSHHETAVDISRVYIPRVTSHLTQDERDRLAEVSDAADGRVPRRVSRTLDAATGADEIAQLKRAVDARSGRFGVLLVRDAQDLEWTRFSNDIATRLASAAVPVLRLNSMFPDGETRDRLLVSAGFDGRPNELAHNLAAREIFHLMKTWSVGNAR